MSELYKRIAELCKERETNITEMCRASGAPRGSLTDLKNGRTETLTTKTLTKISEYFHVSVDYLLGRTDDPIDYDNDGDALAEIPLSYAEACDGDMRRARALMLAVDEDAQREYAPTPVSESGRRVNIVKIAGRDGSYKEKRLTDEQVKAIQAIIDQMPEAPEDL